MFFDPDVFDDADLLADAGDAAVWDGPDAVGRVVEVAGMMAVLAAERLSAVAVVRREALEAARRGGRAGLVEVVERSVRLELAAALRVTEYAAGELLALADAVDRYPVVWELLHRAEITQQHAQLLVTAIDGVEAEHREVVLARGAALAVEHPVGTFRRMLRVLVEGLRAVTLPARYAEALQHRRVAVEPAEDGMAWLSAFLPAVEAHAIHGRLTVIAGAIRGRGVGDDVRTLDQVRADALCDLLIDGDTASHPDAARGIRASVVVTVPVLTLLARDGAGVASVEGVGPIPTERARELCGGADGWMRVLTHPETGMVLSVGRDRYVPPPSLRKLVKWRAERCMAPGCGVPASRCQIDHTLAWEHGGHTALTNHAPLCQGHHTIKHHGGWSVTQLDGTGGAIQWTSPTGRRYVVAPERPTPAFQPTHDPPAPF